MTRHGDRGPLTDGVDCPCCDGTGWSNVHGPGLDDTFWPRPSTEFGMCWPCAGTGNLDAEATPEELAEARLDYERVAREVEA